jgi:hypothetical protein
MTCKFTRFFGLRARRDDFEVLAEGRADNPHSPRRRSL